MCSIIGCQWMVAAAMGPAMAAVVVPAVVTTMMVGAEWGAVIDKLYQNERFWTARLKTRA